MQALTNACVILPPFLLLVVGLVPNDWAKGNPRFMAVLAANVSAVSLAFALLAGFGYLATGFHGRGIVGLSVYFDSLSAVMLALVSFIGAVVIRYSGNYLDGDPGQGLFMKWLAFTLGSVLTLVVSGNLILFTLAWMSTSLSLHRLLVFYPDRESAVVAARKKFVISRLGDVCLIASMALIYLVFGSLEFADIFAAAEKYSFAGSVNLPPRLSQFLPWASLLLALGAVLKSAQFPFHSWLPEVMETPTPVSALMHAGIINAGGFLIIRMSHVMVLTPSVLSVLAVVGAVTALFGALAMLTQTSVKKSLAFSTVGQMGFMMLQCGLGAFSSAVLHIVAHACYKAHAFLSSGSIVDIARASWAPPVRDGRRPKELLLAFAVSLVLTLATAFAFGISLAQEPGVMAMGAILQLAMTYLLWNALAGQALAAQALWGVGIALLINIVYFSLQRLFMHLLHDALPVVVPIRGLFSWTLIAALVGCFMLVLLLQVRFPGSGASRIWQVAYVHFYNGFYVSTIANRLICRFWPVKTQCRPIR
jgi:NAD(P)H-quinone oxidoreductase subunit 5